MEREDSLSSAVWVCFVISNPAESWTLNRFNFFQFRISASGSLKNNRKRFILLQLVYFRFIFNLYFWNVDVSHEKSTISRERKRRIYEINCKILQNNRCNMAFLYFSLHWAVWFKARSLCYIIKEWFFLHQSFFVNYILSFSLVGLWTIRFKSPGV